MSFHALILIPIVAIFWMWHRSLPSAYSVQSYQARQPQKQHKNKHVKSAKSASVAGGICAGAVFCQDDSPWQSDDEIAGAYPSDYSFENNSGTMSDDMFDPTKSYLAFNIYHDTFSTPDFSNDMFDPAKSYLPFNIYHDELFPDTFNDPFIHDISTGIDDMGISPDFGIPDISIHNDD